MFAPRAILMCVHFDFIEVHYRERRFASEKRITLSRVIARRIIQTVRVRGPRRYLHALAQPQLCTTRRVYAAPCEL